MSSMNDLVELHDRAIKILEDGELDCLQEQAVASYTNGVMDLYCGNNKPVHDCTECGDVADTIDEMWQRGSSIVEDKMFKRALTLICKQVIFVASWSDDEEAGL